MRPEESPPCPVCGSLESVTVHAAQNVPIFMNAPRSTAKAAREIARGDLAFRGCQSCGFVWNAAFDNALVVYDDAYENNQGMSAEFDRHLEARAQDVLRGIMADSLNLVEIGCGQGEFLHRLVGQAGGSVHSATGFDPAFRGSVPQTGPISVVKSYFGPASVQHLPAAPDLVVSRHVIEHIPDPVAFLTTIRATLGRDSRARIFLETPRVEWIFENFAMQDFFYEHCSLFSEAAMEHALRRAGFVPEAIRPVFGGQYLWAEARAAADAPGTSPLPAPDWMAQAGAAFHDFGQHWRARVTAARETGPVAVWGAGAKGVSFIQTVDPEARLVTCVIDINPAKQGKFLPGTGHPILGPEAALAHAVGTIFVMNPNYRDEIGATLHGMGSAAELVSIN